MPGVVVLALTYIPRKNCRLCLLVSINTTFSLVIVKILTDMSFTKKKLRVHILLDLHLQCVTEIRKFV